MVNLTDWKVMKLCERQLRDINPQDVLKDGLYRKCNIYKGGGGYDKFTDIFNSRQKFYSKVMKTKPIVLNGNVQFVVQLKGCPLRCPYCYVTPDGIHTGECVEVTTFQLVKDFYETGLPVFHLMGGAPALYIEDWEELIDSLGSDIIFHSDLLLVEKEYPADVINRLGLSYSRTNTLYAVSVKGTTAEEFKRNTGVEWNEELFWKNLDKLVYNYFPFYFTFTGLPESSVENFRKLLKQRYGSNMDDLLMKDSFSLEVIQYEALK